jgi:uncharacterized membrane protein
MYEFGSTLNIVIPVGNRHVILLYGDFHGKCRSELVYRYSDSLDLSSDRVWKKTNYLGEKLFKIAGITAVFGISFSKFAFFIILPVLLFVVLAALYSYIEY